MRKSVLFLSLFLFSACAHKSLDNRIRGIASIQDAAGVEGLWDLQGSNSVRGPYTGDLELRRSNDGTYNVVRIITYISFYYQGLRVQEIWTGKAVPSQDSLVMTYDLKPADFVTKFENEKRVAEDFTNRYSINEFFKATNDKDLLQASFSDKSHSTYREWITTKRPLETQPLWVNQRTLVDAKGPAIPAAVHRSILKAKARIGFNQDALVKAYSRRSEFKNEQVYLVFDPTDYDFYQKNNEFLRVENKPTDAIALVESLARRNAYALTLRQKARGFEKDILEQPQAKEESSVPKAALYTASQAMRFLKTKNSEALDEVLKTLQKLFTASVSTDSQFLVHAFLWGSIVVPPENLNVWTQLKEKSRELLQSSEVVNNPRSKALVSGLVAYVDHDEKLKQEYQNFYKNKKSAENEPESFYWHGSADWDSLQARTIERISELLEADLLGAADVQEILRERLMNEWVIYAPAQPSLLTLAGFTFAYRKGTRGKRFNAEASDVQFQKSLQMSVWKLKETPYPAPQGQIVYDHSQNPEWCLSPIPRNFWKNLKNKTPSMEVFYQGLYDYPAFESLTNVAFAYKGQASAAESYSGVDYLYSYWLGRYSGILDEKN